MNTICNEIMAQEQKLLARNEPAALLAELIDDEFIEYGSNGKMNDKNEAVRWLAEPSPLEIRGMNFETKFLSEDVILLSYISEIKENHGSESKFSRRISIWRKKNSTWTMILHHGISIEKPCIRT
ncbi:DUF4440 domain-containing protein [Fluoribacter gormanii]|uniref:DUF4440 domain-containing protein n=1 Tax=Fluoribacter gormanii TaxID=464 RepID=UPI002243B1A1|nr:DUF4440 domain-containing protein [Fluoribacter gormanii]MCW8444165.1 DUF4440 domain-containing protein [Fluoribacter gormanii]MCW8469348.1 DUF4440 domain-containing protein [Fluoribacter gormanii]